MTRTNHYSERHPATRAYRAWGRALTARMRAADATDPARREAWARKAEAAAEVARQAASDPKARGESAARWAEEAARLAAAARSEAS
jgi:hypothetical protein